MMMGYSMNNGFKTIEIEEVNLYGRKSWNFKFMVNGSVYNTRNTDDEARFIKHLESEYYFEEVENTVEI